MTDPYKTLGVPKDASADDIHKAYRKLAKKHHPDLNPGNKSSEEKFKDISTAHDLLSDPEKRARFDRGEIDAGGEPRYERPAGYRNYADMGGAAGGARYGGADAGMGDIFADLFAHVNARQSGGPPVGGTPITASRSASSTRSTGPSSASLCRTGGRSTCGSRRGWTTGRRCGCAARGRTAYWAARRGTR